MNMKEIDTESNQQRKDTNSKKNLQNKKGEGERRQGSLEKRVSDKK